MDKTSFFPQTMAKRRNKRVSADIRRRMPSYAIQRKRSEKEPNRIKKFTNSQAVIPWQDELLEPQEVIKKGGNFQRLPDRYTGIYKERVKQNNYQNHVYRTDTVRYGVTSKHLCKNLRRRDVGTIKGSAAHRIF